MVRMVPKVRPVPQALLGMTAQSAPKARKARPVIPAALKVRPARQATTAQPVPQAHPAR